MSVSKKNFLYVLLTEEHPKHSPSLTDVSPIPNLENQCHCNAVYFPATALQVSRNKVCTFLSNLPFSDKMQTAEAITHITSQGVTVTQNTTLK